MLHNDTLSIIDNYIDILIYIDIIHRTINNTIPLAKCNARFFLELLHKKKKCKIKNIK